MKVLGFIVFMILWCGFCALQDYVIKLEAGSLLMLYGYLAGLFSWQVHESIAV